MSQNARGAVVLSEKVFVPECSRCCSSIGESICPRMLEMLLFYRRKYLSQNARGAVNSIIGESICPRMLEVLSVLSEKVFIPECSRCCSSIGESIYPRMFKVLSVLSEKVFVPEYPRIYALGAVSSVRESICPRMLEVL